MVIVINERGGIYKAPGVRAGNNSDGIRKALQDGGIDVSSHTLNDWTRTPTGSVKTGEQHFRSDGDKDGDSQQRSRRAADSVIDDGAAENANVSKERRVTYADGECEKQSESKLHARNGHSSGPTNAHENHKTSNGRKLERNCSVLGGPRAEDEGEKDAKAGKLIQVSPHFMRYMCVCMHPIIKCLCTRYVFTSLCDTHVYIYIYIHTHTYIHTQTCCTPVHM
jgi:hypothetical protein